MDSWSLMQRLTANPNSLWVEVDGLAITPTEAEQRGFDLLRRSRNPEQTRAILAPFQKEAWAVALRQGDDALRDQVNGFLSSFRADGGFDRLADTYLDEMKAAFEELGYPFVF